MTGTPARPPAPGAAAGGVGVAIVGCGRAGAQHAEAIAAAGCRVVALCDTDEERARELSASAGAPARTLPGVLADGAVDVVAVCTPPDSHLALGLRALAAGRAAVIEKPPVLSRADLVALEAAAQRHGRPLAVMLQHRGRLPEAALARPWSARSSAVVEAFRPRPPAHYGGTDWRGDPRRSGGGFFAHLAIHYADLACQLLGTPEQVHAIGEDGERSGIDVRLAIAARMTSGALLTVNASSLPELRGQRLHVVDGGRSLTLTEQSTSYVEDGHECVLTAPSALDLRASVYREVATALRSGRPLRRFAAASSTGIVALLERTLDTAAAAPALS